MHFSPWSLKSPVKGTLNDSILKGTLNDGVPKGALGDPYL